MECTKKQLKNTLYKKKLKCIVPGCNAVRHKRGELIMHRLPKCPLRRKLWLTQISRLDLTSIAPKTLNKCYHVCSQHFRESSFSSSTRERLIMTAYPELNLGTGAPQNFDPHITDYQQELSVELTPEVHQILKIELGGVPEGAVVRRKVGASVPRLVSGDLEPPNTPRKRARNSVGPFSGTAFLTPDCLEDLLSASNPTTFVSDDIGNFTNTNHTNSDKNEDKDENSKSKSEIIRQLKNLERENLELKLKMSELQDRYYYRNRETLIHDVLQDLKQVGVSTNLQDFVKNQLLVTPDEENSWSNTMKSWSYNVLRASPNAYLELSKVFEMPSTTALIAYRTQQEEVARKAALQIYGANWSEQQEEPCTTLDVNQRTK